MSRKQQPKDSLGFIFDVRSGAVRAQGGCSENMKEKVQAVRAVVPQRSTTEILLVLQHFDNAVDSAVQAFMEGNASEVLKEWTVTGKKKNKKKKPKPKSQPGSDPAGKSRPGEEENWEKSGKSGISQNGFRESPEPLGESPRGGAALGNGIPAFPAQSRSDPGGKKMGAGLEKSRKELRRCGAALARCRALLREELQGSLRRLRAAFSDIHACLMDREVALLAEMDKVKAEAMELLALRQRRAEALRELTEAAPGMSEEQLLELRADIKHFVSERKLDEELGRAGRFGCDLDALRGSIGAFGQVSHPRPSYSSRSRCSSGPAFPAGSAPELPEFPAGSAPEFPEFPAGSAPEFPEFPEFPAGSAPEFPEFPAGSAPEFPEFPEFPAGSAPEFPEFPAGSAPGSPEGSAAPTEPPQLPQRSRKSPGAAGPRPSPQRPPGIPKNPGIPQNPQNPKNPQNLENPKNPKNPQNPENPKSPKNPPNPGIPKNPQNPPNPENPKNHKKNPKNPQNPKIPKINPKNPKKPRNPKPPGIPDPPGIREAPGKLRRSRPEGANS